MEGRIDEFLRSNGIMANNVETKSGVLKVDLAEDEEDFENLIPDLKNKFDLSSVEWTTDWDRRIKNLEVQNSLEKVRNLRRDREEDNRILNLFRRNLEIRLSKDKFIEGNGEVVLGLSGDLGSMASLLTLKEMGFDVKAVTIDPGSSFIPMVSRNQIRRIVKFTDSDHDFVDINRSRAVKELRKNGFRWDNYLDLVESEVKDYALSNNNSTIIFGSFRNYGKEAVKVLDNVVRINLPGLFGFTEEEVTNMLKSYEKNILVEEKTPIINKNLDKKPVRDFYIRRILDKVRKRTLKPFNGLKRINELPNRN